MTSQVEGAGPLDRYRLIERLGVGASASVWRARDRVRGRDVALKVLHPHLADDRIARQRLALEASAARRLRHPGICRLLGAHLRGEQPALVFEWVAGETLAARLERSSRLAPAAAAAIAAAVAAALAHAHERGVVHRDVKPSNILLGADGSVRLLDFGVADGGGASQLTEVGSTVGTLAYMAPEQLAGETPVPASDVYGLGVVLYEMLAGHRPYDAASPLAMARAHESPPPPLPAELGETGRVAIATLRPDPSSRPSAAVVAAMLGRAASGREDATEHLLSVAVTAVVAVPHADEAPAGRRRALAGTFAAIALVLAGAVALAALAPASPHTTGQASPTALVELQAQVVQPTQEPRAAPAPNRPDVEQADDRDDLEETRADEADDEEGGGKDRKKDEKDKKKPKRR